MAIKSKNKPVDPEAGISVELRGLTIEQIKEKIQSYSIRLEKATKNRNYMQLERDMVSNFLDVTRKEVLKLRSDLHNRDHDLEKLESDHRVEVKVYEQKVKHLDYQHRIEKSEIQQGGEDLIIREISELRSEVAHLTQDRVSLLREYKELCNANEADVKELEKEFANALSELEDKFANEFAFLQRDYEAELEQLDSDLDLRRRVAIHEVEERKNMHINELMLQHRESFAKLQAYYNDITHDNLKLIQALKEEILQMNQKQSATLERIAALKAETAELSGPLEAELREVSVLEVEIRSFEKDALVLSNLTNRSKELAADLKRKEIHVENLESKLSQTKREHHELKSSFEKGLTDARTRAEARNAALAKKVQMDRQALSEIQLQIEETTKNAQMDPAVSAAIAKSVETSLMESNRRCKDLKFELARAIKSYNDSLAVYKGRLVQLGVTVPEKFFERYEEPEGILATSYAPVNLVTKVL